MDGKRTGDRTGDGTEKKPLWCAGCVWGGQAGLGIAAPAFPRVKGCVPHASPPQSRRSLPAAAWIGEKGGPSPARSPVHPRVCRVTAAVPTPRIPPRKRMQSGRSVQRAVSPLGGTIQRPHTEAFPLCTLPGLTTWRDPSRPLRSPAGGGGRPPARCCSCRSDRALARLRRHRHPGYGQRRDLARAPAAVQGPDAAGWRGGATGKGRGRLKGRGLYGGLYRAGGSMGLGVIYGAWGAPWGWECAMGFGGPPWGWK